MNSELQPIYSLDFLRKNTKFTWEGSTKLRSFSCFKDKTGYWKAQKKVEGKVRQKRLGNDERLATFTSKDFSDIATFLTDEYTSKNIENESLNDALKRSIATSLRLESENIELQNRITELENKKHDILPNLDQLLELREKIQNKETGYKANSASKLINDLLKIIV